MRRHRPRPGARALIIAAMAVLTLAACATQPYAPHAGAPGFLYGLVQGFIAWIDLLWHFFDPNVRIYAYPNAGPWYDFGYLIGVTLWGGGGGAAARR